MAHEISIKCVEADFTTGGAGDGLPTGFTAQWADGTGNGEFQEQAGTLNLTFTDAADGYTCSIVFSGSGGDGGGFSTQSATVN